MKYIVLLICLFSEFHIATFAQTQTNKKGNCPIISILSPNSFPNANEPVSFQVVIDKDIRSSDLKFNWTTSFGKITEGQGTKLIKLKLEKGISEISTTVEVFGLPETCPKTATAFISPEPSLMTAIPTKVDEFGKINNKILSEKIKSLAEKLTKDPTTTIFIVKSFTETTTKLKTYLFLQETLRQLNLRQVVKERVFFVVTPNAKVLNEFWIVLPGSVFSEYYTYKDEVFAATELKKKIIRLMRKR